MSIGKQTLSAWLRGALLVALIAAMAAPIGACGRKGSPEHPKGSKYPREYPYDQRQHPKE